MTDIRTIKNSIQAVFPESNYRFGVNDFINVEMALTVAEKIDPKIDAKKVYLLLCNYSVIGKICSLEETSFLEKAHIRLRSLCSKRNWNKKLEAYRDESFSNIRLFDFQDKKDDNILTITRNKAAIPVPSRTTAYEEEITSYIQKKHIQYALKGRFEYWISNNLPKATVELNSKRPNNPKSKDNKEARELITVSVEELINSAEKMKQQKPDDYCTDVLSNNVIKEVKGNSVIKTDNINISGVTNMVGMVGSGKSTIIKVLSYHLANKGHKIVIVLDTVSDVMSLYGYFKSLNISVSPLIGRNERLKYINQVVDDGQMYLKPVYSEYLSAACIVNGITPVCGSAPEFGNEPCHKLIKNKERYICPYYSVCPSTKMQRDAVKSDIVITTVAGLAAIRIGSERDLFLNHVLEQADLVIFDECDRVQKNLDEFFAPSMSFMDFINNNADYCSNDMKKSHEERRRDYNEAYYSELLHRAPSVLDIVENALSSDIKSWTPLKKTFSSMTLYEQLKEDGVPEDITNDLYKCIDGTFNSNDQELNVLYSKACDSLDDGLFDMLLNSWLSRHQGYKHSRETFRHIKIFMIVAAFDAYIHSIEDVYSMIINENTPSNELAEFLSARFAAQQKILPSSVLGNLFGMKSDNKNGLQLYRQYAFGRSLMTKIPWLRMSKNGEMCGPHVLLLSGSSWADGCLEYHINSPVNYLLETEEWKRELLSKTEISELGISERVSGSGQKERLEHLKNVIKNSMDTIIGELERDGKILVIVNSYKEADTAREHLQSFLNKENLGIRVACMMPGESTNSEDYYVPRGTIAKFHINSARILVAPAAAIERGYNIVDETGHSSFGSVFFMVRPMPVPDDITQKCAKLNGLIDKEFSKRTFTNEFEKAQAIRRYATKQWNIIERNAKMPLKHLEEYLKRDVTASIFILILQIFGRLARITDTTKSPPRIYFVDGAFRTGEDNPDGYDCLNELIGYLDEMMNNPDNGEIAKTLYQPFYVAFKKGVYKREYREQADDNFSDGFYSENEYNI